MEESREGRCYELAAHEVLYGGDDTVVLCHGWPILAGGPYEGQRYGHAWVERTRSYDVPYGSGSVMRVNVVECFDTVSEDWIHKALFYAAGRIEEERVAKYTPVETRKHLCHSEVFGPWTECPYNECAPYADDIPETA